MVSFQYCTGDPSQYNKTRKNEVYELERKRLILNDLLANFKKIYIFIDL